MPGEAERYIGKRLLYARTQLLPGLSIERVVAATEAKLIIPAHVPEMALGPHGMLTDSQR